MVASISAYGGKEDGEKEGSPYAYCTRRGHIQRAKVEHFALLWAVTLQAMLGKACGERDSRRTNLGEA